MPIRNLLAISVLLVLSHPCRGGKTAEVPAEPVPVVVLCNGDDGLTQRLCEAIKKSVSKSPHFTQDIVNKTGVVKITIPTNVKWKRVQQRTQVQYLVEFSSDTEPNLGHSEGSCWETNLTNCAVNAVAEAERAIGHK